MRSGESILLLSIAWLLLGLSQHAASAPVTPAYTHIYWTEPATAFRGGTRLRRSEIDGANVEEVFTDPLIDHSGLAVDPMGGGLYLAVYDGIHAKIQRRGYSGGNPVDLATASSGLFDSIGLDFHAGKIYWTYSDASRSEFLIQRANLDGSDVETVHRGANQLIELTLDPLHQQMYWLERLNLRLEFSLRRANLDGSGLETLFERTGGFELAADPRNSRLYLAADSSSVIYTVYTPFPSLTWVYDRTNGVNSPEDLFVDPAGQKMYWLNYFSGEIMRSGIWHGVPENPTAIVEGLYRPRVLSLGIAPEPAAFELGFAAGLAVFGTCRRAVRVGRRA